jgi:hypothetical protein
MTGNSPVGQMSEAKMDSGSVKPVRRWPLLPSRKAGEPATVPVSPTGHVNPAVAVPAAGIVDSNERRKRPEPARDPDSAEDAEHPPAHQVDREI